MMLDFSIKKEYGSFKILPMINTYKMRFEVFRMLKNCFSFENVKLFSFYGPKS